MQKAAMRGLEYIFKGTKEKYLHCIMDNNKITIIEWVLTKI